MNLFILAEDHDECAEYHIDKHIGKMQLEAAQIMATALWVDKILGHVPRKLNTEELGEIKAVMAVEPPIEQRTFIRYKAAHHNHPCTIWCRESLDNFIWTHNYVTALNSECIWRGYKSHASCAEVLKMPDPQKLPSRGLTPFAMAMPDELKSENVIAAYHLFYELDKGPIATWKRRGPPAWWNPERALTDVRYTELTPVERQKLGYLN